MGTETRSDVPATVNRVELVGRVSGVEEPRELPSGDIVVALRVVVPRETRRGRKAQVDTIDVACWSGTSRRVVGRLRQGDTVRVEGTLHRRFFRTGAGVASRYEVEARRVERLATAPG